MLSTVQSGNCSTVLYYLALLFLASEIVKHGYYSLNLTGDCWLARRCHTLKAFACKCYHQTSVKANTSFVLCRLIYLTFSPFSIHEQTVVREVNTALSIIVDRYLYHPSEHIIWSYVSVVALLISRRSLRSPFSL